MSAIGMKAAAVSVGLVLLYGCASPDQAYFLDTSSSANVYVAPVPCSIRKLAILPFKAETELIGGSVSDMFITELLRAGRYELVERSQMAKVLGESELALSGLSDARAAEVASMLGAEGVVIGTVDEYGTVAVGGHPYPQVGISVRMIDCANGKIMWSADLAKRADSKSAILSAFARSVVHEMAAGMYLKWQKQSYVPAPAGPAAARTAPGSEPAPGVPPPPPERPVFTLSDMGLREVKLAWTAPAARAKDYSVERAPEKKGPFQEIGRVSATRGEFRDAGSAKSPLTDSTMYFYRLTAVSVDGQKSEPSFVKESMTAPPPEAPAGAAATACAPRAVKLTWQAAPAEAAVKEYVVERAPDGEDGAYLPAGTVRKPEFQEGGTRESPLADNTAYRYRVRAVNAVDSAGPWSEPVKVVTLPPPAPVTGVEALSGEVRCVPLAWTAPSEPFIAGYEVSRAAGEDGDFVKIATLKGAGTTKYLDGGRNPGNLPDDTLYRYRVTAVNTLDAPGAPSEEQTARTRPVPPAVTGAKVESGQPRMVLVTWEVSADEKATGYLVQRADKDGMFVEVASVEGRETVAYEDRGRAKKKALGTLSDGTTYVYRVAAFNAARATGAWSEPAEASTKPAPHAPAGVSAKSGLPRRIDLAWQACPETDITTYVIERSTDGAKFREAGRVQAGAEGGLTIAEKELNDSETRHYRVKAIDRDTIESVWSDVAPATTKPLPPAPTELAAEAMGDGYRLSWQASAVNDIASYSIWQKGFLHWTPLGTSEKTEILIPALKVGKGITVAVTIKDADGLESLKSAPLAVAPQGGEKK